VVPAVAVAVAVTVIVDFTVAVAVAVAGARHEAQNKSFNCLIGALHRHRQGFCLFASLYRKDLTHI
jgi:hypothetical protein